MAITNSRKLSKLASKLEVDANNNLEFTTNLEVNSLVVKENIFLVSETANLSSTAETMIASFDASLFGSARIIIQATDGVNRHTTEMLIVHDSNTAFATEYGTVITNTSLFTVDVGINTGMVEILATSASANETSYKVYETLIKA